MPGACVNGLSMSPQKIHVGTLPNIMVLGSEDFGEVTWIK